MSRDFHICHPPVSRRTRSDVQRAPLQSLLDPHRNSTLRSPKRRLWRLVLTSITSSRARAKVRRIGRSCRRVACTPCTMHPVERHAVDTRRIAARASARSGFLTYVRRGCQMTVMPGDGKSRSWVHPFVALRVCLPPSPSTSQRLRGLARGGNTQQQPDHRKVDQRR
jgi:hypothetical protein